LHGATIDVNGFLKAIYVREAKGLSVTPLSIFYRKHDRVPPVLGQFSDIRIRPTRKTPPCYSTILGYAAILQVLSIVEGKLQGPLAKQVVSPGPRPDVDTVVPGLAPVLKPLCRYEEPCDVPFFDPSAIHVPVSEFLPGSRSSFKSVLSWLLSTTHLLLGVLSSVVE